MLPGEMHCLFPCVVIKQKLLFYLSSLCIKCSGKEDTEGIQKKYLALKLYKLANICAALHFLDFSLIFLKLEFAVQERLGTQVVM